MLLGLVGLVLIIGGAQDGNDTQLYIGVGIVALAIIAGSWHSELQGRGREEEERK